MELRLIEMQLCAIGWHKAVFQSVYAVTNGAIGRAFAMLSGKEGLYISLSKYDVFILFSPGFQQKPIGC